MWRREKEEGCGYYLCEEMEMMMSMDDDGVDDDVCDGGVIIIAIPLEPEPKWENRAVVDEAEMNWWWNMQK